MEESKGIVEAKPSDKFILDMRDSEEAESGMLVGAKNIASQDVVKRLSKIPKDKEVIIPARPVLGPSLYISRRKMPDARYAF